MFTPACIQRFLFSSAPALAAILCACQGATASASASPASTGPSMSRVAPNVAAGDASAKWTVGTNPGHAGHGTPLAPTGHNELAAFAAGCFWGVEDAFRHVPGVVATAAGYAGGHTENPSYAQVCTHTTGHAETVLVEYDPTRIPYEQLLRVFWKIHDPTQVNRQGPDVGDSYRSVVFTFTPEQVAAVRASMKAEQRRHGEPIATEIRPMRAFYAAEGYHQQYSERTGSHSCPIGTQLESL